MKEKSNSSMYKILTIIFGAIIVLGLGYFVVNSYATSKFQEGVVYGRVEVLNMLVGNVAQNGQVGIPLENGTLTLVPVQSVQLGQQQGYELALQELLNTISEDGSVTIYNNETQMTLAPVQIPQEN
ncbi:MAG: hypothetical protein ACOCXG_02670 [Nanoarchaeota archaeon]